MSEVPVHAHAQSRDSHEEITAHPSATVNSNKTVIRFDASALAIVALIIAVGALVAVLMQPSSTEAKIRAGTAQAEATAREARTTAKVTEDKLYELRDALNAKGMNLPKLDGH
jgi:hypothetical protein